MTKSAFKPSLAATPVQASISASSNAASTIEVKAVIAYPSLVTPDPMAAQHGHSVITMLRSYAKWLPKGDNNRNLNKVNSALGMSNSALEPHLQDPRNQKTH